MGQGQGGEGVSIVLMSSEGSARSNAWTARNAWTNSQAPRGARSLVRLKAKVAL